MRALRHWTIHRAWMLARRKKLDSEERELERFVCLDPYPFFHAFKLSPAHFQNHWIKELDEAEELV
jgi:hypothetical protein